MYFINTDATNKINVNCLIIVMQFHLHIHPDEKGNVCLDIRAHYIKLLSCQSCLHFVYTNLFIVHIIKFIATMPAKLSFSVHSVLQLNRKLHFDLQVTPAPKRDPDWIWTGAVSSRKAPRSSETAKLQIARRRGEVMDRASPALFIIIGIIGITARWPSVLTLSSRLWKVAGRAAGARSGKNPRMLVACNRRTWAN